MAKPTKKQLIQAIIDCNNWVRVGEGVGLLYFYEMYISPEEQQSYLIIKDILGNDKAD